MLAGLSKARLGERAANQRAQSHEAAMEDGPGASRDSHIPRLEHLECKDRGVGQVPQFMSEESEAFAPARALPVEGRLILFTSVLGHGARDRLVQAAVQCAKVIRADGRVQFNCEVGDGLTDVTIIVHDLRHGEPLKQQVMPVLNCAPANLRGRCQPQAQGVRQLIQEHRHAVVDFGFRRRGNRPHRDLFPAPPDDLFAVHRDEFMQHKSSTTTVAVPLENAPSLVDG